MSRIHGHISLVVVSVFAETDIEGSEIVVDVAATHMVGGCALAQMTRARMLRLSYLFCIHWRSDLCLQNSHAGDKAWWFSPHFRHLAGCDRAGEPAAVVMDLLVLHLLRNTRWYLALCCSPRMLIS